MAKPILDATIVAREDFNDTLSIFRLELEGGVPDFEPGQFVTLGLPDPEPEREGKMVWRAYSIASAPSEKRWLELYIRWARKPVDGKFTTQLWKLPVGAKLKHRGCTGPFTVEMTWPDGRPDDRRLLLVGGGTGLAPFVSFAVEFRQEETREAGPGEFKLVYVPTISRPQEEANAGWSGATGRVETLLQPREGETRSPIEKRLDVDLTPEHFACYVCGYDNTVKAAMAVLEPKGFRTRRNKREDGSYDLKFESYG